MPDFPKDYSAFDRPEILNFLFHPRGDFSFASSEENSKNFQFTIDGDVKISAKLHFADKKDPIILFFHGNGEIVSDYDDLGPMYSQIQTNFCVFDYRGYGKSTGTPTVSAMMNDCHVLFNRMKLWLRENNYTGPVLLMGRSLGSASALELASAFPEEIDALIIESGFAFVMPLLKLLGVYSALPGVTEESGPVNYEKIKHFKKPTLIIHAEHDHIIPFSDGRTLYENSPSDSKKLLEIKGADHNSIFYHGLNDYLKAIQDLVNEIS